MNPIRRRYANLLEAAQNKAVRLLGIENEILNAGNAQSRFGELLEACANSGPQTIESSNGVFVLTLLRADNSPRGKSILTKGGPLDQGD